MRRQRLGDIEAFKEDRASREAWDGWLIDAAMREIRAGNLDADLVHEAMKLGTHEDHPKLKQALENAHRARRACGAL